MTDRNDLGWSGDPIALDGKPLNSAGRTGKSRATASILTDHEETLRPVMGPIGKRPPLPVEDERTLNSTLS
jgi:hypothetical protein